MADNDTEDVTHVEIENMSFSNYVIIYTEGLVTLYKCTLHDWIEFFIYKSKNEPDFTYKTAEIIPSTINNNTINIINTSFHGHLYMYLLSGIKTVNIICSDFVMEFYQEGHFVAGNKSVEKVNSHHLTVLNITIINSIFTKYSIRYLSYGRDSLISMKTIHSKFNDSSILQFRGEGYFGTLIEDSKFHECQVVFQQVMSVSMRNCEYEVTDDMFYDNVKIVGNDKFSDQPEGIQRTI